MIIINKEKLKEFKEDWKKVFPNDNYESSLLEKGIILDPILEDLLKEVEGIDESAA